jgi:hypothetical protein
MVQDKNRIFHILAEKFDSFVFYLYLCADNKSINNENKYS